MSSPILDFISEQLEWLKSVLAPGCCYVTGEHNPRHFREGMYVCGFQERVAYRKLRVALGMHEQAKARRGVRLLARDLLLVRLLPGEGQGR